MRLAPEQAYQSREQPCMLAARVTLSPQLQHAPKQCALQQQEKRSE
jgi:hypothetical protein